MYLNVSVLKCPKPCKYPNSTALPDSNVYTEDIKQLRGPGAGLLPSDPAHPSALLLSAVAAAVVIDQVSGTTTNNNV